MGRGRGCEQRGHGAPSVPSWLIGMLNVGKFYHSILAPKMIYINTIFSTIENPKYIFPIAPGITGYASTRLPKTLYHTAIREL